MLYRITYSELAKQEIENIFNYIVYDLKNVKAAIDLRNNINRKFKSLKQFPYAYPIYKTQKDLEEEYRILVVNNYLLFYIVDDANKKISIERVIYRRKKLD
ncbi:type II toxin-antitoxin system RelE/ParE family toxin [Macrococcoides bohemicum]|uniref:type II toxin-antitoxin system RelE/ParE family toxin n=1 Tax=Macrococcoides bohemicum TaxID=1903056 RepID=UPI00193F71BF|nr:type II toxin-antitoxin system RelE/ParE family toxin [Macrococcus bohemicus]QRN48992.1 type II toxin-antitoxin system RelE/ParE family toxin [Macrococcus bohemicus]